MRATSAGSVRMREVKHEGAGVLVFGHGPEDGTGPRFNTLPSFRWCREQGADGVELDVRRTADDHVVVVHDHQVDGTDVAATRRRDLPDWIPDLSAVLDACRGLTVIVELKNFPQDPAFDPSQRLTHLVVDLLAERDGQDDVVVSCFGLAALDVVRERSPRTPTAGLLFSREPTRDGLAPIADGGHAFVHPYDGMVDERFVAEATRLGLQVDVWMLEVPAARFDELAELGVHGVITPQIAAARAAAEADAPLP
jgi:glycerophosphoryl diester phosphodiesterase